MHHFYQNYKYLCWCFLCTSILFSNISFAQLTGIKTIPGDYASIAAAVSALNSNGVGGGGVIFNVAANYTETGSNIVISATGSSSNSITFQKSGAGSNPLITASTGISTTVDGIIELQGTDYITFDGIDLAENAANLTATTRMEYGYGLLKTNGNDGAQHVIIRNCSITMSPANSSSGIYAGNHTPTSSTSVVPSSITGGNSFNKFYNNTITNAVNAFKISGYNSSNYYDQANEIGTNGGNLITYNTSLSYSGYGFYLQYQTGIKIANNTITNLTLSAALGFYGMYFVGTTAPSGSLLEISSNIISNINSTGTGNIYGLYLNTNCNKSIYQNVFQTWTSAGASVNGIYIDPTTTSTVDIYRNKIADINTTAATGAIQGIYLAAANSSVSISNNIIGDFRTPNSNNANALIGINIVNGVNVNCYFNSVYFSGAGVSGFGSSCIYTSTTPILTMNNNLLMNNSTPSGTGIAVAFRRTSASLSTYSGLSSNNLFYAGTPSASHLLYSDGTNAVQSLCNYLDLMIAPREDGSLSENPNLLSTSGSSNNFLHLNTVLANLAESGGIEITGITSDYDATSVRPAGGYPLSGQTKGAGFRPDIGADEMDATPSAKIYVCSTTNQVGGIATQGNTNEAVLRMEVIVAGYSSTVSATQFNVNASGTTNINDINATTAKIYYTTTPVFSTATLFGSANPSLTNFNVNGNQPLQTGRNYFWLAYDISASATCGNLIDGQCISMMVGGISRTPTITNPPGNKKIKGGCNIPFYTIDNSLPASCSNYTSFTSAIADLNLGNPSCPVIYKVAAGQVFNECNLIITASGSATNTIQFIKNGVGTNPKLIAAPGSGPMDGFFIFSGTDYITIDGIDVQENPANTNSTTQIEWGFGLLKASSTDGCQHVTIKNCNITLNKTNASTVGIYGGNHITSSIVPLNLFSTNGSNSYNSFYNNTISNSFNGISLNGFNDLGFPYSMYDKSNEIGVSGGNTISDFGGATLATASGIYTKFNDSLKISNNNITNGNNTSTGVATAYLSGIHCDSAFNANMEVQNNNISAINSTNYYVDARGIWMVAGNNGLNNTININNNTLQSIQSVYFPVALRSNSSAYNMNIYNNELKNVTFTGGISFIGYGIYAANAVLNFHHNSMHDVTSAHNMDCFLLSGGNQIENVYNNSLYNCSINTATEGWITCMSIGSGILDCHDNTFHDISTTSSNGTYGPLIWGITGGGASAEIYNNTFYNWTLINTGTNHSYNVQAIVQSGTSSYIHHNQIHHIVSDNGGYGIFVNNNNITGTLILHDNQIHDFTSTSFWSLIGVYNVNTGDTCLIYNNELYNLNGSCTGMYAGALAASVFEVHDNSIHDFTGNSLSALYTYCYSQFSVHIPHKVYRNKIYSLQSNYINGDITGIYAATGPSVYIYNNFISDLRTPNDTSSNAINAIYTNNIDSIHLYNNSIYLNSAGVANSNFSTTGIYLRGNFYDELINNLVINNSMHGSGGFSRAIRNSGSNLSLLASSNNNNNFFAGTPSSNNLIYSDGVNNLQTLAAFQSLASPRESNSLSVDVSSFFAASTDLHLSNCAPCAMMDAGLNIAALTDDIDLQSRPNGTNYEIGADEITTTPLPVELISFDGKNFGGNNHLTWATASENDLSEFQIERSANAIYFHTIGKVKAINSGSAQHYYFDDNTFEGAINYYRLKMTDKNGSFKFSNTISLLTVNKNDFVIYPNPANDLIMIAPAQSCNDAIISIYNAFSQLVMQQKYSEKIDISTLNKGVYFLKVESLNDEWQTDFVKE